MVTSRSAGAPDRGTPRRAVPTDAEQVAEVWLRSRKASVPDIPPPAHDDDDVRAWIATRVVPHMETWVTERDGAVVAMLVLEAGWVEQLYVDPAFTGQGVGSELLDLAKQRYPGGLDLWAFQSNTGARRFYERHGFVTVEMTDRDNEEGAPDVHYRWPPG